MQTARYFRTFKDSGIVDEITALEWIAVAQDNTESVYVAMRDDFETSGARYWVRLEDS